MIKEVKNTLKEHKLIEKDDTVIIGLSGGPDSVCLFHVLHKLKGEYNLKLNVVHVNHQLRLGICDEEQAYVEGLCRRWDTPCYSFRIDCNALAAASGMSGEEAGRAARYDAFYQVAEQIDPQCGKKIKIAVAHNLEDQAETVLLRIIRGTGTDGLAGMGHMREGPGNTVVIRPLLDISRTEIEKYLINNNLEAKRDHTNLEPIYKRNKVRLELIPLLKENYNSNIVESLARLAGNAWMDRTYLRKCASEGLALATEGKNTYDCGKLIAMEPALRRRAVVMALADSGLDQDVTSAHLEAIDKLIDNGKTGACIDLPQGYFVRTEYGKVIFSKAANANRISDEYPDEEKMVAALSKVMILGEGLTIRTRQDGDRIDIAGVGQKKLQNFFVDEKVPRENRNRVPLIVRDGKVIAIIGDDILEKSNYATGPLGLARSRSASGYKIKFEGGLYTIEQTS